MSAFDELLAYCFDGRHPAFEAEFAGCLRASRRLRAFVEENRSKIRAKLKSARDEPGLLDVRAELAAAAALLGDERFALTYEAYAAGKRGGPDFTATFRTHTRFNIEVRRLHGSEARASSADGAFVHGLGVDVRTGCLERAVGATDITAADAGPPDDADAGSLAP